MKRLISLLAALTMLFAMTAARAEYDLEGLSLEALYELREAVDARIGALELEAGTQFFESGLYHVGEDIPAGDYVLMEEEDALFASVSVHKEADPESTLIIHHLINGQAVIRLKSDTWVTFSEACAYPISTAPRDEDGVYAEGGYWVGETLPAGRYALSLIDGAPLSSYSIYDDILGVNAQLIKFEVLHEPISITVHDGDYIELSGCELGPNEIVTEDTAP